MRTLTEQEVAARLGCSTSKIKRWRRAGALPYIPGRPVLIDEADLDACLESMKCRPTSYVVSTPGTLKAGSISSGAKAAGLSEKAQARLTKARRKRISRSGS
ncbi:helix-turn-helix domain-containing protein [Mangrovibrevibacter kandeliae]|uniref:helix-turn-helix domain-containing protein n=1 Tax=Mangrovibrevibacter kandeliae TaxID=2968473 RepID=UPI00222EAA54|nr:helix-turn-helix domain-containing protein [Aurantimonas sp. MSK8Z-1]